MNAGFSQMPLKAASDVLCRRVIRVTAANTGDEATAATQEPVGISDNFTKFPPGTAQDSPAGLIAATGDAIPYKARGEYAEVVVGAGGVTGGTRVEAGAAGVIVALGAAGSGKWSVGIVQTTAAAGDIALVFVDPQPNV